MALARFIRLSTFRAEKSKRAATSPNSGCLTGGCYAHLEDMMALAKVWSVTSCNSVVKNRARELRRGRDPAKTCECQTPFPRITYDGGDRDPQKRGNTVKWGTIRRDEETILSSTYDRPVMASLSSALKAFYMQRTLWARTALGFDMLAPRRLRRNHRRRNALRLRFAREKAREVTSGRESTGIWTPALRQRSHAGFGLGLDARSRVLRN